jgi:DNA-binding LacI/PurR family transcriptional regulator
MISMDSLNKTDKNKESLHIKVKQQLRLLIDDKQPDYLTSERQLQKELGISRTTVRKALNELIQEKRIIPEQGRGYRVLYGKNKSRILGKIGFALMNDSDVFVNSVFQTMFDEVFSKKLEPVVTIIDLRYENPAEKISRLLAVTDGIFINSKILRSYSQFPSKEMYRCVALPYTVPESPVCSIMADMKEGARIITKRLLADGHRKIATLFSDSDRSEGFHEVMNKNGIKIIEKLHPEVGGYRHLAYEAMGRLLSETRDFTAVICQNDIAALGAIEQCFRLGIKVPEDISIVGFDNISEAELFPVPLTTAGIDLKLMCKKAMDFLLEGLRTGKCQEAVKFKPDLVIRKSIKKISKVGN